MTDRLIFAVVIRPHLRDHPHRTLPQLDRVLTRTSHETDPSKEFSLRTCRGDSGGWPLIIGFVLGTAFMLALRALLTRFGHGHSHGDEHGHGHGHGHGDSQTKAVTGVNLRLVVALAVVVLIDGAIIGIALSAGGAAALLIAIALSIELLFVAASTAGSARAGGGSLGTAIGVGAFVAVMMPIGAVLGAVVFAGVSAPVLIAGLGFGAAALLFTAVAELLVEAYEIKESTGTIAMAAGGFLLFLILMMLM
ncbi:hypothetical protein [Microbacterium aerolatum]|uniref:hypothetical protein n=1 Tax=Microbacterium aerolatum TaxID=153731 RepID=UPI00384C4E19